MARPILLLPPSEGKAGGGASTAGRDRFAGRLGTERRAVRDALGEMLGRRPEGELESALRARGELLRRSIASNLELVTGRPPLLPAWRRYTGVVWEHLEPASLAGGDRARILVPSAVYGLHGADDAIADYRLTMHVSLPGIGNLARYWRPAVSALLEELAHRAPVVDLLPAEHARSVDTGRVARLIRVRFLAGTTGERAAGHGAKAVKGRFARHLLDAGIDEAGAFEHPGWTIEVDGSNLILRERR